MQVNSIQNYNNSYNTQPNFKAVRFSQNYRDRLCGIAYSQFPYDEIAAQRAANIFMRAHQPVEEIFALIDFDILKLVERVIATDKKRKEPELDPEVCNMVVDELLSDPQKRDLVIDDLITCSYIISQNDGDTTKDKNEINDVPNAYLCDSKTVVLNDVLPLDTSTKRNIETMGTNNFYDTAFNLPGNMKIPFEIFNKFNLITTELDMTNLLYSYATFSPTGNLVERQNILKYFNNACLPLVKSALKKLSAELGDSKGSKSVSKQ